MKRFAFLLACLMVLSVLSAVPAAAEGFELNIEQTESGAVVTGFTGTAPAVLQIPDGVTAIGDGAFRKCGELEEVLLPEGLTSIGKGAFLGCTGIREVTWPGTLTAIWDGAFCGTAVRSLVLPERLRTLAWGAFNDCTALESVSFPAGLHTIGTNSFRGCTALTDIQIPEGVVYLGGFCFAGCTSLVSLELPGTIQSIQDGAFKGCTKLVSLDIPEGPDYLSYTFADCSALESVSIPASVVQIEGHLFSKCDKLATVRYGGTKEAWTKALTYGDSSVHSRVEMIYGNAPAPSAAAADAPSLDAAASQPTLREGSGLSIQNRRGIFVLTGVEIGRAGIFTSAADVLAAFSVPDGTGLQMLASGVPCSPDAPAATGNEILLTDADGHTQRILIEIPGDVTGTGILSVAQAVRLAQALNGTAPLAGSYLAAGCLTGGQAISVADLVLLAQML